MLLEHIQKRFAYNEWAWQQIYASVRQLDEADYYKDRGFFWGSIHGMLVHGLAAEFLWLSRSQGISPSALFGADDYPDLESILNHWQQVNANFIAFVGQMSEADLGRTVTYRATEGDEKHLLQRDILEQVLNHATEHRSQLTPTLVNLGHATCWLDYTHYCLEIA